MVKETPKNYEEQTFTDEFMFGKVMEDKDRCRRVLECLLGRSIGELQDVVSEKQMRQTKDGKMIRFDIFTKDDKSFYDMEMQNLNHKSVESLELPKRSRFYQSEIDVDFLARHASYKELPENNVVFICTFDPFGRGEPLYEFENKSNETPPRPLNDGTKKYYFNCTYEDSDIPEELIHFYEFVRTGKAEDVLTEDLRKAVEENRMNYIYRNEYLRQRLALEDARDEGREEGREEQRARADAAEARAEAAEEEVRRLQKFLAESEKK